MTKLALTSNWSFKEYDHALTTDAAFADANGWQPAQVPGTVHQDLLTAGAIPDPYWGMNDTLVQWVGERDWLYRCRFDLPDTLWTQQHIDWCAAGLDTYATIWLNGTQIGTSENMFVPQRVPVKPLLRPGTNELRIAFTSAWHQGLAHAHAAGTRPAWNGDPSRLYVRKAQYQYGWDWGPTLLTMGVWQPTWLEAYDARVADLHVQSTVAPDLQSATLTVRTQVAGTFPAAAEATLVVRAPDGVVMIEERVPLVAGMAMHASSIRAPQLWWPHSYGAQPLYTVSVSIACADHVLARHEQRIGLRRLRLVQEALAEEPGQTFYFEINNTPIFCGGANWIPADMLPPRVTDDRYRQHLQQMVAAHMVMVRVWGGGIYEPDSFYDLCDELGILVWQDFMFACGAYPADAAFQGSVGREAEAHIRRLRHHPALALWCGNNEDYWLAELGNLMPNGLDDPTITPAFPARAIYEHLLPDLCATLDPGRPYWPGSPYGGSRANDPLVGDRHVWDVWHGDAAPYQDYPRYSGRFVSEFGLEGAPDMATFAAFADPEERYPQSRTVEHHNRSTAGYRHLAIYLSDNVRYPATLDEYIYATQLLQAEAMESAISGWRRQWGGPGHFGCGGALVWQLNDCWPGTSWSLMDVFLRPKAAYYTTKRALAPVTVNLRADTDSTVALWATTAGTTPVEAQVHLSRWTFAGKMVGEATRAVTLTPNQTTEIGLLDWPRDPSHVFSATLSVAGEIVARTALWPEPFKYITPPDPGLTVTQLDAVTLCLAVERPAKGVLLFAPEGMHLSDNMLDLIPGEPQCIQVEGATMDALSAHLHLWSLAGEHWVPVQGDKLSTSPLATVAPHEEWMGSLQPRGASYD